MQKKKPAGRLVLIGEHIDVTDADNKSLKHLSGTVIDETKNTITINTNKGNKMLVKDQITIRITNIKGNKETEEKQIAGKHLIGRTEARIKSR